MFSIMSTEAMPVDCTSRIKNAKANERRIRKSGKDGDTATSDAVSEQRTKPNLPKHGQLHDPKSDETGPNKQEHSTIGSEMGTTSARRQPMIHQASGPKQTPPQFIQGMESRAEQAGMAMAISARPPQ
jgi:hypothetical protein